MDSEACWVAVHRCAMRLGEEAGEDEGEEEGEEGKGMFRDESY